MTVNSSLAGDSTDWTNNYGTKFFDVQQRGGWFSKDPPTITTKAGSALLLLLLLLCPSRLSIITSVTDYLSRFFAHRHDQGGRRP